MNKTASSRRHKARRSHQVAPALCALGTHQRYDRLKQIVPGVNASPNSIAEQ
jgi:hypothetical protein